MSDELTSRRVVIDTVIKSVVSLTAVKRREQ